MRGSKPMKSSNALIFSENSLLTVSHLLDELESVPVRGDAEKMVLQVLGESVAHSNGLLGSVEENDIEEILAGIEDDFYE